MEIEVDSLRLKSEVGMIDGMLPANCLERENRTQGLG